MSEFAWFIAIGALIFAGVILIATIVKAREVRRARRWPSAPGTVVVSKVESHERGGVHKNEDERMGNYPLVVYEFTINGVRHKGKRISVGEAMPNVDVESTLDKYPVGASVEVFYDPHDPKECVLERDFPPGFAKILGCLIAFIVIGAAVLILVATELTSKLEQRMGGEDDAKLALLLGGMGLFAAMIAYAQHRQLAAAKKWPSVRGTVTASHIERYLSNSSSGNRRRSILFRPHVVYAYSVGDRKYSSDRLALGMLGGSSKAAFLRTGARGESPQGEIEIVDRAPSRKGGGVPTASVEAVVRRYPIGSEVEVFYDPKKPSEALLERRMGGAWLLWTVALGLLAGAVAVLLKR